jgi:hypothetical protein
LPSCHIFLVKLSDNNGKGLHHTDKEKHVVRKEHGKSAVDALMDGSWHLLALAVALKRQRHDGGDVA